jgi:DNA-binding PadR family transcriptional regulator
MPSRDPDTLDDLLPLKPVWFHILLSLADGPQHGYGIRTLVEERTQGGVRLWPATLYGALHRLAAERLVDVLDGEADPDDDARRQYYRLTQLGGEVLRRETERLEALVMAARGTRALGRA